MKTPLPDIRVPIPFPEDEEVDLVGYFADLISDEFGEIGGDLLPALDLDVNDDRATIDEISIEEVVIHEEGVAVHYSYTYSAYYGCDDMNYSDEETGTAFGKRVGTEWVFERHVSPERQAPNEEL